MLSGGRDKRWGYGSCRRPWSGCHTHVGPSHARSTYPSLQNIAGAPRAGRNPSADVSEPSSRTPHVGLEAAEISEALRQKLRG